MNGNNDFLSGYNSGKNGSSKNGGSKNGDAKKDNIQVKSATLPSMKYEEKSGFVKPKKKAAPSSSAPRGKRPNNMVLIIGGVAAIAVIAVVLLIALGGGGVEVKNFEGWAYSDVQLWANENNIKLQPEQEYNDAFDEGKVISQGVAAGEKIKKGEFLPIKVSKGHDMSITLELPDLSNMTKDEVEAWAAQNFMSKVRITTEYSDTVPMGKVIRYEVNDNTVVGEVRRDTPVYVIVSKGKEDEAAIDITVPDFKTKTISECFVFAAENGINLIIEEQYDDYVPKGSIISQSVKPEEKVKKGTEITVVLSKGKKIIVPDFSGYSKEKAQAVALELGVQISIKEKYSGSSEGRFLSQNIAAGSVLEDGDFLELVYSMGNKIVVASYVGQTRDAIESWAKELNKFDARITIKATYTQSNQPAGTIIHQDIANKVVGRSTTIRITVSEGSVVFVPDFVAEAGLPYGEVITREDALKMCEEVGIIPIFIESASTGRLPGEVWSQSVAAGEEAYQGSTITLKYTPSAQTQVPDFKGMTKQEILDAGHNMKLHITFVTAEEAVAGFEGKVYEQSVAAGTTVATGTKITLTISPQAAPETSETPESTETPEPTETP